MVFKFTDDVSLEEAQKKRIIKKDVTFNNKIVFINGFGASGKTMVSPIISSMDRVESIYFPYELQWVSSFLYASKIDEDTYGEFIKQYCDHITYNLAMGRNSNFRFSDISSIFQSKKRFDYLKRIFQKGDNDILDKIKSNNPTINFTSQALLIFINEITRALSNRVLFIETVRDPLYMFIQAKINHDQVHIKNREKHFTFDVFEDNNNSLYFDFYSNPNELGIKNINHYVLNYLNKIFKFYFNFDPNKVDMKGGKLIFLPFEKFVIKPDKWIREIIEFLNIKKTTLLVKELKKQKVPRKYLTDGFKRSVYKRYMQYPIDKKFESNDKADENYKEKIKSEFNKNEIHLFNQLLNLSNDYRDWIKKFDAKISWN